jgi:hypothetical protein
MAIDDKRHRELMTKYIEYIEKDFKFAKGFLIEIEKPYNFYGSRGFIDVLFSIGVSTSICEVKPVIFNLGEAIRQLRKAQDAIRNNAITDFQINNLIYLRLVTHLNEQNITTLKDSYPILKNIKNLIVDLYCQKTREFFFITSNSIIDQFLEKYGDPLDKRWEMCKNGESQYNNQGLRIV